MPRVSERLNKITYTARQLAYLLDCSESNIYKLAEQKVVPRPEQKGQWSLVKCLHGYLAFVRKRSIDDDGEDERTEGDHRKRLTKARADIAEMEAERLAGQLVPVDRAERVWTDAVANFRQRTLAVAHKAAPQVAVEGGIEQCHEIIEAHIHEALAELAGTTVRTDGSDGAD